MKPDHSVEYWEGYELGLSEGKRAEAGSGDKPAEPPKCNCEAGENAYFFCHAIACAKRQFVSASWLNPAAAVESAREEVPTVNGECTETIAASGASGAEVGPSLASQHWRPCGAERESERVRRHN